MKILFDLLVDTLNTGFRVTLQMIIFNIPRAAPLLQNEFNNSALQFAVVGSLYTRLGRYGHLVCSAPGGAR
jgi:hypothetical protein